MTDTTTISVQLTRKGAKNVYVDLADSEGEVGSTMELHPNQHQQIHLHEGETVSVYLDDVPSQEETDENNPDENTEENTDDNPEQNDNP